MSVSLVGDQVREQDYVDLSTLDFDKLRLAFAKSTNKNAVVFDLQQAIDQVLRANLASSGVVVAIIYYNLVLISPLALIVLLRRLLGTMVDPLFAAISRFFERWGKKIVLLALLGVGAVLALDAIGWFIEFPLLPSYLR